MAAQRTVAARLTLLAAATTASLTPVLAATPAAAAGPASLCAPPADTVPPQVTDLTVGPASVDVGSTSRTVTITAQATDTSGSGDPSGVRRVDVFLEGPNVGGYVPLARTAGDPTDGTWTGSYTLPKYTQPGTLRVYSVRINDHANNANFYDGYSSTANDPTSISLQSGWQSSIALTGTAPSRPPRNAAGRLAGFSFHPVTINTTRQARNVSVKARFHGQQPTRVFAYFATPNGRRYLQSRSISLHKHPRAPWTGHLRVGRWAGSNTYRPSIQAYFAHSTPSTRRYQAKQLKSHFFAAPLRVTTGTDDTRPTLQGLTITPSSVDTTTGAETVEVKAIAVDSGSGVKRVEVSFDTQHGNSSGGAAGGLYPYPGVGYSQSGYVDVVLTHRAGNTWTGSGTFQECEPTGDWRIIADLRDRAGNSKGYLPPQLAKVGLQSTLSVTSTPGDIVDPYVYSATASGQHQTITLDFSEGVKNVSTSTLTVFAMRPVATRYQHSTPVTGVTCSNGSFTIACDGSEGLITSADLDVPDLQGKVGAKYEVYANLDSITSQLTDGTGNPMDWEEPAADATDS